jgi:hypothetical protein
MEKGKERAMDCFRITGSRKEKVGAKARGKALAWWGSREGKVAKECRCGGVKGKGEQENGVKEKAGKEKGAVKEKVAKEKVVAKERVIGQVKEKVSAWKTARVVDFLSMFIGLLCFLVSWQQGWKWEKEVSYVKWKRQISSTLLLILLFVISYSGNRFNVTVGGKGYGKGYSKGGGKGKSKGKKGKGKGMAWSEGKGYSSSYDDEYEGTEYYYYYVDDLVYNKKYGKEGGHFKQQSLGDDLVADDDGGEQIADDDGGYFETDDGAGTDDDDSKYGRRRNGGY